MIRLFEQPWNGHLKPYKYCGKNDPEVDTLYELAEKNQAALENALEDEQKALFERHIVSSEELAYLMRVYAFRDGFSLAARLLAETLPDRDVSVQ